MSKANKHHYVPQFYLRQFSCPDDVNKVSAASFNRPFIIKNKKSIEGIGYEDNLYSISNDDIEWCIEEKLNRRIETPITQSETWSKIKNDQPELINEDDKLVIYLFMRHIEVRNVEQLQFIRSENIRVKNPSHVNDYSDAEREMHAYINSTSNGSERFFLEMANDLERFLLDYSKATISILKSNIQIRTSTNPVVTLPESMTYIENENSVIAKWLPLSPRFGALLYMSNSRCDFYKSSVVENNVIRAFNRLYLLQLLNSLTVRHLIANDEYLIEDFLWAGIQADPSNPRKFRVQTNA